jgi:hypothetical protein
MKDATREQIVDAFENFSKWETYSMVFTLMTQRKATLREIQEIAADPRHDLEFGRGISPAVIAMRRRDILGMKGGLEAHRREIKSLAAQAKVLRREKVSKDFPGGSDEAVRVDRR